MIITRSDWTPKGYLVLSFALREEQCAYQRAEMPLNYKVRAILTPS